MTIRARSQARNSAQVLCAFFALTFVAGPEISIAANVRFTGALNDTGQIRCSVGGVLTTECSGTGQDAEFGRDVDFPGLFDGRRGFSFVRVCNSGEAARVGSCPALPPLGSGANEWGCTVDRVTSLMWSVQTETLPDGGSPRFTNWGDGRPGDASLHVLEVNARGLCGQKDWRLPKRMELQGLVDYAQRLPEPLIDTVWFPNTEAYPYWTSHENLGDSSMAWIVNFSNGFVGNNPKSNLDPVRLVRALK